MKLVSWSMAKSITQALVGKAASRAKNVDTLDGQPALGCERQREIPWRTCCR